MSEEDGHVARLPRNVDSFPHSESLFAKASSSQGMGDYWRKINEEEEDQEEGKEEGEGKVDWWGGEGRIVEDEGVEIMMLESAGLLLEAFTPHIICSQGQKGDQSGSFECYFRFKV